MVVAVPSTPCLRQRFGLDGQRWAGQRALWTGRDAQGRPVWIHLSSLADPAARSAVLGGGAQRAMVEHPSFARVLGCGRAHLDGRAAAFAVVERLPGSTLSEASCSDRRLRELVARFLDGLHHLHRMGLAHGAITTSSLICTEEALVLTHLARPGATPADDLEQIGKVLTACGLAFEPATDARSLARSIVRSAGLALLA